MKDKYILDETGNPIPEPDALRWAEWFEKAGNKRQVAKTEQGGVLVSTVFLGLNHRFGDGPPLLYETMIFGGDNDDYQTRCCTRAEALEEHRKACALVRPQEEKP